MRSCFLFRGRSEGCWSRWWRSVPVLHSFYQVIYPEHSVFSFQIQWCIVVKLDLPRLRNTSGVSIELGKLGNDGLGDPGSGSDIHNYFSCSRFKSVCFIVLLSQDHHWTLQYRASISWFTFVDEADQSWYFCLFISGSFSKWVLWSIIWLISYEKWISVLLWFQ